MRHPRLAVLGLVLLLFAAGCSEGNLTEPFHPGDALHTISDGAHDGMEGFYFLPPMVRAPSYSGVFDPSLSPVVEICQTPACEALHASFSMTDGTGSELVRLDDEAEHYKVNWHTDQTGTVVGQTYRVRVSVAGTVLGYADIQMAANGREAKNTTSDDVIGLVDGRTLPIQFRIEAGAGEGTAFLVGPGGGTFTSNDGVVTIEVPEGAVKDQIRIMATPVVDTLDDPDVVPDLAFEFLPSPYTFEKQVMLTIGYDPESLPEGIPADELRLLELVDDEWVQLPGSSVDTANSTVSGPLESFSRKAVGRGKVHAIAVSPTDASIEVGETLEFVATVTNVDGEEMDRGVRWSSTDDAVATVDNSGLATAVALGEATIEARSGKVSGSANLTVAPPAPEVTWIDVAPATATIEEGTTQQFTATVYDQYDEVMEDETVTWSSSDNSIAAVDSEGLATASSAGVVTITASLGSVSRGAVLTVEDVPAVPEILAGTISAGHVHSCGLDISGNAYCWGDNDAGQLGDGTTTRRLTPVAVLMPAGVTFTKISSTWHTVAVTAAGDVFAWGENYYGQLGDGTTTSRSAPVAVSMPAGATISTISAGEWHTVALTSAGDAYAWGWNGDGSLGDGTTVDRTTPVAVSMPAGVKFSAIDGGGIHTVALTSSGDAYAWGWNESGTLGDGTTTNRTTPVAVSMPAGVKFSAISAGGEHTVALSSTGDAYAWGRNSHWMLGDGTTTNRTTPVAVSMPAGVKFSAISGGSWHTVALATTGDAYAWGLGQLGDGTTTGSNTPVAVLMPAGVTFFAISVGQRHTLALTGAGDAYGWGNNLYGQLGDGTYTNRAAPVQVIGGITFDQ